MTWLGEFPEDFATVTCMFTTHDGNGAPLAPLTAFENADVRIYKNGSATEKTSQNGVTMTSPFDSITGLHCLVIDTSNDTGDSGFWTTDGGGLYTLVLSPDTETVNGQTVAKVIGQFRIKLTADTAPTAAVNAAAVWDLDATAHQTQGTFGQAIGDPVADTNTIFKAVVTDATAATIGLDVVAVQADADDIQTRLPAALVSGRIDASVGAMAADTLTAAATATDFGTEIATAVLTKQMTESYAANGSAPTLAQAQFAIHQMLMQFGISGTSLTVKKLDNATTAFIVTLDSATSPTSAVRT